MTSKWMTYSTWKSVQFSLQIFSKYFSLNDIPLFKLNQSNFQILTKLLKKTSLKNFNIYSYISFTIFFKSFFFFKKNFLAHVFSVSGT